MNHQLPVNENEAAALVTLLAALPYYTSELPEPYDKARQEWIYKLAYIFPSLHP
mgnify:CR=1 FL=1|jgi:hypothetical protein